MGKLMNRGICLWLVALLVGCSSASTKIDRIEETKVDKAYRTVLVFAVSSKNEIRNSVETSLVTQLNRDGFDAEAFDSSADSFPWNDPGAIQSLVSSSAKAGNFDGVLVTALVKKERDVNYVPEQIVYMPVVVPMGPLASMTYMETTRMPSYFQDSVKYTLKSTLFDTDTSQPVWQVFSSTLDPESLDSAIQDYGRIIVNALHDSLGKADR
jgi:hypothetical protein